MRGWRFTENKQIFSNKLPKHMGCIYAVKLKVMQNFYLVKIGATEMPKIRFGNYGENAKIFCLSPPHYNCYENEHILQDYFEKYRVPQKPNTRGGHKVELFNISLTYLFKNMPSLNYEIDMNNCKIIDFGTQVMYYSKR